MLRSIGNRLLRIRLQRDEKTMQIALRVFSVVILFLFLHTAYLTYKVEKNKAQQKEVIEQTTVIASPTLTPQAQSLSTITNTPTQVTIQKQQVNTPLVKEYFIPLGTGTNQSSDWENVAGTETSADFGQYTNIKEIRFEASVSIPSSSQIVWVRLFNKTDKHPVWYSEVVTKGETSAYLVSQPIIYDTTQKTYQVQIKSQLKGLTNLVQSRIHITLQ